jgi:hypothetical protein
MKIDRHHAFEKIAEPGVRPFMAPRESGIAARIL